MHPASSVIFFTTATGAGYGLMAMLAASLLAGGIVPSGWLAFMFVAAGFALIVCGLLASTFHLGHPERAWRALTQWRSSWLSREGVFAVLFFIPAGLFALVLLFAPRLSVDGAGTVLAMLVILLALATVFATGMIYAQLRAVPAWATPLTPLAYLSFAAASGATLFCALNALVGLPLLYWPAVAQFALFVAGVTKLLYWMRAGAITLFGGGTPKPVSTSTISTATGLGAGGHVRQLDAPHTEANYLMKEMGFRIARAHAEKLRAAAVILAFVLPPVLFALGANGWMGGFAITAPLAFVAMMAGIICERWLFFAEAKHVVTLYYGARRI